MSEIIKVVGLILRRIEVQKPPYKKGTLERIIYRTVPIKAIVFFCIILTSFIASQCATSKKPANKQSIRRIDLLYQQPIRYDGSAIVYLSDSISIFYMDTLEVYRFPVKTTHTVDDSVVSEGVEFCYFVRGSGDSLGYWQPALGDTSFSIIKSDSILTERAFYSFKLKKDDSKILVRRLKLPLGKQLVEYVRKQKSEGYTSDTIRFVYDKTLADIPYTFSPYYEQSEHAKLVKIEMVTNQSGSLNSREYIPRRVMTLALTEKAIGDTAAISRVIRKYHEEKKVDTEMN